MSNVVNGILEKISGITKTPEGAFNIRVNGKSIHRESSKNIHIESREDGKGIRVTIDAGTKGETLFIPVVIEASGLKDVVYNDFYIGEDCDIKIVAGCGIHNGGDHLSQHDGIHTFHVGKNAKVRYEEKHYGEGNGQGMRILNPETILKLSEGSYLEMETVQIEGVSATRRVTKGEIGDSSLLVIKEKLMTDNEQAATTEFQVDLNGVGSRANIISRSVAKGNSKQTFLSVINGNNQCAGHSECDAIIMGNACVKAVPDVTANHADAELIHEAAIGKIAGEQIIKLMTLGLTEEEAEAEIVAGFLR